MYVDELRAGFKYIHKGSIADRNRQKISEVGNLIIKAKSTK